MTPAVDGRSPAAIGAKALAAVCAVASVIACASPCAAQVIELGSFGAMVTYDRPAVFTSDGAVAMASPLRRPASPRPGARPAISAAAAATDVSEDLIAAVAWIESRMKSGVVSRAGAVGEMQLMPSTARALGVDAGDSTQNYLGGASYLRGLMRRYDGDIVKALAAYNAGPGAVDRFGGVPPFRETQAYVAAVLERMSVAVNETKR